MKVDYKSLIINLFISLGVGLLAGFLTRNTTTVYQELYHPPLAPPALVFPVVWTILYTLMGISSYLIFKSHSIEKTNALIIYILQLMLNFIWSIVFFNLKNPALALIILVTLWITIFKMIDAFKKINIKAANLQIPYLLWVTFALYLNYMYVLNL